jgi:hypothetical protein
MRVMRNIPSGVLLSLSVLLVTHIGAAPSSAEQSAASLVVTPSPNIAFSGPPGGPFSPPRIEYRVRASAGTIRYSIRTPAWLTASSTSGIADTNGVAIALSVDTSAANLSPGTYGPGIAFMNVSNGRGSATFPARLTVRAPLSPSRPAGEIGRARGGYLLDSHGAYLLDDLSSRLLAQ